MVKSRANQSKPKAPTISNRILIGYSSIKLFDGQTNNSICHVFRPILISMALLKKLAFCSNPGNPFSMGVTLAKLAAVTMDEQENETFDTSGALDKLRKVNSSYFSNQCDMLRFIYVSMVSLFKINCITLQKQLNCPYLTCNHRTNKWVILEPEYMKIRLPICDTCFFSLND